MVTLTFLQRMSILTNFSTSASLPRSSAVKVSSTRLVPARGSASLPSAQNSKPRTKAAAGAMSVQPGHCCHVTNQPLSVFEVIQGYHTTSLQVSLNRIQKHDSTGLDHEAAFKPTGGTPFISLPMAFSPPLEKSR